MQLTALLVAACLGPTGFVYAKPKATAGGSKACSHTGFFTKKIVPLCEKHFPDDSSKHAWVVVFYHPYVKKVVESKAAYEELAALPETDTAGAKVGAVDCQQNGPFCGTHGVREVPTTRIMFQGQVREVEGEHSLDALKAFIKDSMARFEDMAKALQCGVKGLFTDPKKDVVVPLCTSVFPPALEPVPWLISFYESGDHNKDKTMRSVMNKLATKYGNVPPKKVDAKSKKLKLRVGAVDCSDQTGCGDLGVTVFPTVRFYRSNAEPSNFDSFFDKDELQQWADARLKEMPKQKEAVAAIKADMPDEGSATAGGAEL